MIIFGLGDAHMQTSRRLGGLNVVNNVHVNFVGNFDDVVVVVPLVEDISNDDDVEDPVSIAPMDKKGVGDFKEDPEDVLETGADADVENKLLSSVPVHEGHRRRRRCCRCFC